MIHAEDFPKKLASRLAEPLPGREAQYRMANLRRFANPNAHGEPPENHKIACVLVLIFQKNGSWHTALIERSTHPADRHAGQISFPGGKIEESDENLGQVALRETEEEIGVPRENVEILGSLTNLYIPVSNFLVHPFVGWLRGSTDFSPQPGEVQQILTPPLAQFFAPDARKLTEIQLPNGILLSDVPYFEVENHIVWGATAMILNELIETMNYEL